MIAGSGEWKAGEGRAVAMRNLRQELADKIGIDVNDIPRPGVATAALDDGVEQDGEVGAIDHEDVRNPRTGEWGGYQGREPTLHGDWAHKGRCTDFE